MSMLTRISLAAVIALSCAVGPVLAHEITYEGTVVALETARYARPGGGFREVQELEVVVMDPETKRMSNRVFTLTEGTRVLRDGKRLPLADAAVQKDDPVAVVIDHDKSRDEAIEVRLLSRR